MGIIRSTRLDQKTLCQKPNTKKRNMKLLVALALLGLAQARPQALNLPLVSTRTVTRTEVVRPEPIAITRYNYDVPSSDGAFAYSFETENGIKQEAAGEMKVVDDSSVLVMRGSYEYIGADGLTYVVDWVADELGFRASAPHLPKPVEPNHPEVREAVAAQLRCAAEQRALARSA